MRLTHREVRSRRERSSLMGILAPDLQLRHLPVQLHDQPQHRRRLACSAHGARERVAGPATGLSRLDDVEVAHFGNADHLGLGRELDEASSPLTAPVVGREIVRCAARPALRILVATDPIPFPAGSKEHLLEVVASIFDMASEQEGLAHQRAFSDIEELLIAAYTARIGQSALPPHGTSHLSTPMSRPTRCTATENFLGEGLDRPLRDARQKKSVDSVCSPPPSESGVWSAIRSPRSQGASATGSCRKPRHEAVATAAECPP